MLILNGSKAGAWPPQYNLYNSSHMFPSSLHCIYHIKCEIAIFLLYFSTVQPFYLGVITPKSIKQCFFSYYGNLQSYRGRPQVSKTRAILWLCTSLLWIQIIDPFWFPGGRSVSNRNSDSCWRNRARHIWSSNWEVLGLQGQMAVTISVLQVVKDWPFSLFFRLQRGEQWNRWPKYTVSYVGYTEFMRDEICFLIPPIKIIKRTESDIKSIHFHDKAHYEQRKYSLILTCSHYCSKIYHVGCNVQGRKGKLSVPLPLKANRRISQMILIMFSRSAFPKLLKGHNSSSANQDDCSAWAAATNTTSPLVPMETALGGEMVSGDLTRGKKSLWVCNVIPHWKKACHGCWNEWTFLILVNR